jgi:hypothetical protein
MIIRDDYSSKMTTDVFLIVRHPASSQASYDLVQLAAENMKLCMCVYGLQNNSPSASRAHIPWHGVSLVESGADRISVQHLLESIEKFAPKAIVIVHSVHIVAGIASGIEPYLAAHPAVKLVLHAESIRSSCAAANLKVLSDFAKRPNVRVCAASECTAKMVDGHVVPWSCYPHLLERKDRDAARKELALQPDKRVVLIIGRADAVGILGANLIMADPDAIVIAASDLPANVKDICKAEMMERGRHTESDIGRLLTMREIGSMTHSQFCCLASAIDVAVHANPCNEPTLAPVMLGMLGVPQAITQLATMTEALSDVKNSVAWVDAGLTIYSMDDMGGKVQLSSNTDLFEATRQLMGDLQPRVVAAARAATKLRESVGKPWAQWMRTLEWACDKMETIQEGDEEQEQEAETVSTAVSSTPEIVPVMERARQIVDDVTTLLAELKKILDGGSCAPPTPPK